MGVSRLLFTTFFGSALLMAASDSTLIQAFTTGIDSGVINTLVYNPARYWKIALLFLFFILSANTLEKVRYFTIVTDTMAPDLDVNDQ